MAKKTTTLKDTAIIYRMARDAYYKACDACNKALAAREVAYAAYSAAADVFEKARKEGHG
jgi:hypothetical protein